MCSTKSAGQGVEQLGVARRVGRAHVVERLDQAAAHRVAPEAVDDVAGEERVVRRRQPLGQLAAAVERVVHHRRRRAACGLTTPPLRGCVTSPVGSQEDDRLAAEQAELLAVLRPQPDEERGHAVVVVLAPLLERVMVALGAAACGRRGRAARSSRPSRSGLRAIVIVVGRPFGEGAALGGDDVADHLVDRLACRAGRRAPSCGSSTCPCPGAGRG